MPVISFEHNNFPEWAEVRSCRMTHIQTRCKIERTDDHSREIWILVSGSADIKLHSAFRTVNTGDVIEINTKHITVSPLGHSGINFLQIEGLWSDERGSCGLFSLTNSSDPVNTGDRTDYLRNTVFDNHFHDCDEYWFILRGEGEVMSEGVHYHVKAGDCVITRVGDHHDFPIVEKEILGVWFEGNLTGLKRIGHLYHET